MNELEGVLAPLEEMTVSVCDQNGKKVWEKRFAPFWLGDNDSIEFSLKLKFDIKGDNLYET